MSDSDLTTPMTEENHRGSKQADSAPRNGHAKKKQRPKSARSEEAGDCTKSSGNKSTGPRTAVGKRRSSRNALKHGIFSQKFLLENESMAEYRSLLSMFRAEFQPRTAFQDLIVEDLAMIRMHENRCQQAERAEIALAADFISIDLDIEQRKQLFEVEESGYLRRGLLRARSNPYVLSQCILFLKGFREDILSNNFNPMEDPKILNYVYGISWAVNPEIMFLATSKMLLERMRAAKSNPGEEANRVQDEAKRTMIEGIDYEIARLIGMKEKYALIQLERVMYRKQAAQIPSSEISERLLRYSTFWSREFDRKLNLLERVQKMQRRNGGHLKQSNE